MPIYTYRCENCGVQFERHQSFDDAPLKVCPECRKKALKKVIGPTRIIFKGSGFYSTDNKSPSGRTSQAGKKESKAGESTTSTTEKSASKNSSEKSASEDSGGKSANESSGGKSTSENSGEKPASESSGGKSE